MSVLAPALAQEREALQRRLVETGVSAGLADRMAQYGALLLATNRRVNLTGAKSAIELLPHLLESLALAPEVASEHVDVGSGGGLPAIPLALAGGGWVTMIEATAKKVAVLRALLEELGIAGEVILGRAELLGHDPELRGRFGSGTARAVAVAPAVAELVLPLLAVGGVAILQRGAIGDDERRALADAALVLGSRIEAERPGPGQCRIFLVRKLHPTGARFPRRIGVPAKRPLCMEPEARLRP
ncbi:MAG: 16S rRNA (guanine(527)-N(7))-methyltransferase RsmG [Vulcanimicrobiaceae bacterium]